MPPSKLTLAKRVLIVWSLLSAVAVSAFAQAEVMIDGTVRDSTRGVLPGVTVTATHMASGNTFVAVTDERGEYRIQVRTGVFNVAAELPSFTTVVQTDLELLVGQGAVLDFEMSVSALQETVTVSAQSPLIDITSANLGGNIEPRQIEALPVTGRNWMQLTLMAPGSRANAVGDSPGNRGSGGARDGGSFIFNVDGGDVTITIAGSLQGEPRFSQDAIAEFEVVQNRFDATIGRAVGSVLNVVTKSGTNMYAGTAFGFFRHDSLNAADFIVDRVLPYANQQVGATFGGPIVRDRVHVFGYYEYEREPSAFSFTSPFPSFNIPDMEQTRKEMKAGLRVDVQFNNNLRAIVRGNLFRNEGLLFPVGEPGATRHPSFASLTSFYNEVLYASLTQVVSNRAVNEVKVGYIKMGLPTTGAVIASGPLCCGFRDALTINQVPNIPLINLRGYSIGKRIDVPNNNSERRYQFRDDLTYSFTARGSHNLKVGGEYISAVNFLNFPLNRDGELDATGGPIPANVEALFPVWNQPSTWNVDGLSDVSVRYKQSFGHFDLRTPQDIFAFWVQDDWSIGDRLTLQLGLRYDINKGIFGENLDLLPFKTANTPSDNTNWGPRLGAVYTLNPKTILRAGWGKFYGWMSEFPNQSMALNRQLVIPETPNDGRPDFPSNPYNGQIPTFDGVLESGVKRDLVRWLWMDFDESLIGKVPYSWTGSLGFQRQIANTMAIQADYVYIGSRNEQGFRNINVGFNTVPDADGFITNLPFSDVSTRPFQDWGLVQATLTDGRSNYHGLETAFTKRFSDGFQLSATYTLSTISDATGLSLLPENIHPEIAGEYGLAGSDQRHRAVVNGIWELPYDFSLSGVYFWGSGQRQTTFFGADLRNYGAFRYARLLPDGSIMPRNDLVGDPIQRVDLRVMRRFRLRGTVTIDAIAEAFNLFNKTNYGSYVTAAASPAFGDPRQNANLAYSPFRAQLGFRVSY